MTDFSFTGLTYEDILKDLKSNLKLKFPDFNPDSEYDIMNILLSVFSYGLSMNNTLLELMANECSIEDLQTRESLRKLVKLLGYELKGYIPATGDLLGILDKTFSVETEVVQQFTRFGSSISDQVFENLEAEVISANDSLSFIIVEKGGVMEDLDIETAGYPCTFFAPAYTIQANDCIYFGHNQLVFDQYDFDISTAFIGLFTYVWEYFDDIGYSQNPDSVTKMGGYLKIIIDDLVGTTNVTGLEITVQCLTTGYSEVVNSQFDGVHNYIETSDYLGQDPSSVSEDDQDYLCECEWHLLDVTDATLGFQNTGIKSLEVTIPDVAGTGCWRNDLDIMDYSGGVLRFRFVTVTTPPSSAIIDACNVSGGMLRFQVEQGKTYPKTFAFNSDGSEDQNFRIYTNTYIEGSIQVWIDSDEWQEVDSFYYSDGDSKHFLCIVKDNYVELIFGDNIHGKIPVLGSTVEIQYRWGISEDGNLGIGSVDRIVSGNINLQSVFNSEVFSGWKKAEGIDSEDIDKLRDELPQSIWTSERAVTAEDIENILISDFSVARVNVNTNYITTGISLVNVVSNGAGYFSNLQLEEFQQNFNGDIDNRISGKLVLGHEIRVKNYRQKAIDITADVYGVETERNIRDYLELVINPLYYENNSYLWEFGGTVSLSKLIHLFYEADQDLTDVTFSLPATNIVLEFDQLPILGTLTLILH